VRVGSTLFGVVLFAVASLVVSARVLFSLGLAILFPEIGISPPVPDRRRRLDVDGLDPAGRRVDGRPHGLGRASGSWAAVMLEGTAFIAIVTALITSTFATGATRDAEAERAKDDVGCRELMPRRFDEIEGKLDQLTAMRRASGRVSTTPR
jgi:hypothetical protein